MVHLISMKLLAFIQLGHKEICFTPFPKLFHVHQSLSFIAYTGGIKCFVASFQELS